MFLILLILFYQYFYFLIASIVKFQPFQNEAKHIFGFDEPGHKHCMVFRFKVRIVDMNLLEENIVNEEFVDFVNETVKLFGICSERNAIEKDSQFQGSWRTAMQRKTIKFVFREKALPLYSPRSNSLSSSAASKTLYALHELKWELSLVEYKIRWNGYKSNSSLFSSGKNTTALINVPLNQKFVCRDAINITLHKRRRKNVIVQLLPLAGQLELQPLATNTFGLGNNVFICERTRKRSLRESFQNRMTIFSGILLGIGSIGTIIGYSIWKSQQQTKIPSIL
ncbi:hypothetical protein Mgra_00004004 [Meloidogyne graminicola]|uniref:Uncharacterized protein n=1 Tax=Meloidogyne graminicola TaxID=189291 RepID=A0A8S9ZTT7_9BILA|nr:hypothetical protein Mgra_00004004 [Meloidogyne graminicola]